MRWFLERAGGVQHAPPAPILLGRHLIDLGVAPGPEMGVILKEVYERQMDSEFTDLDGALAFTGPCSSVVTAATCGHPGALTAAIAGRTLDWSLQQAVEAAATR